MVLAPVIGVGVGVETGVADGGLIGVGEGVKVAVGVGVGPVENSMCIRAAAEGSPRKASATLSPVPVIMITREFPLAHPGLLIISWMMGAILGVCWPSPASPTMFHGGGDQDSEAAVLSREEILKSVEVKVEASSLASP